MKFTNWTPDHHDVGFLPQIFIESDPHTAQEQANARYAHGGGWNSFFGFTLSIRKRTGLYQIEYADDPPTLEIARAPFHDQTLVLFEHSWVGIVEHDKLVDIARLD